VGDILDGRQWLEQRIRFLQEELTNDPADGVRQAIELELAALHDEVRTSRRRWRRWFVWGGAHPPQ
jgi:LPS O-antigen subunit length determinant protein (WzzB/FepE family)